MDLPKPTPTLSLSLTVNDAGAALDFYTKALGANELFRFPLPNGMVAHAEFMIGNCRLFISGPEATWQAAANPEGHTASCLFALESDDPDADYARALEAGCTSVIEPVDQVWGVRTAAVKDPYGYRWNFRKVLEELSTEEIKERFSSLVAES